MGTNKFLACIVLLLSLALVAGTTVADDAKTAMNDLTTVKDVLAQHVGKRVAVRTDDGESLDGTVAKVTEQLVYLEKLAGREHFDAVVRIDRISSVIMRMRTQ